MTRRDALAEMLALTQEALERCARGDANPQTLSDLAARRAILLGACPLGRAISDDERGLVERLRELDTSLLQWGAALQHDLERTRARMPSRGDSRVATTGLLSDIA